MGVFACCACLGIALGIALGLSAAFAYAGYVIVVTLWAFHLDGLAFRYLWPDAAAWNQIAVRPLLGAMALTGLLFARSFLETRTRLPRFDRVLVVLIVASAVQIVLGLAVGPSFELRSALVYYAGFLFTTAASLAYLWAGVLSIRAGAPGAWYFTVGAAAVAVAIVAAALAEPLAPAATMEHTRDWGRAGLLVEAFVFLLGLTARITRIRRERSEADMRAAAALDEKVALSEDLRRAETAADGARALAESRGTTLAYATHDLRQPLTAMRLSLDRAVHLSPGERDAMAGYLDYLQAIVDDHLATAARDVAEIAEAPAAEVIDVNLLVEAACAMFRAEAAAKGLSLRSVRTNLEISADPVAAIRILSNLVANAVKHTRSGGIVVGARRRGGDVLIAVCDTGGGLSEQDLDLLRRPGRRGASSAGTGLGLAAIDALAAGNGLGIRVRSVVGKGSCFGLLAPRPDQGDRGRGR